MSSTRENKSESKHDYLVDFENNSETNNFNDIMEWNDRNNFDPMYRKYNISCECTLLNFEVDTGLPITAVPDKVPNENKGWIEVSS